MIPRRRNGTVSVKTVLRRNAQVTRQNGEGGNGRSANTAEHKSGYSVPFFGGFPAEMYEVHKSVCTKAY